MGKYCTDIFILNAVWKIFMWKLNVLFGSFMNHRYEGKAHIYIYIFLTGIHPMQGWTATTKIIGQRKAFYRQRIPEFRWARKETVHIDILVTSRNCHRKIKQSITITSRPTLKKWKWNQLSQFWKTSTEVIPIGKT